MERRKHINEGDTVRRSPGRYRVFPHRNSTADVSHLYDDGANIRAVTDRAPTDAARLRVVSIVGPSGSGKTSLVESLLEAFDDRRVATIKSIHHDIEPDTPGTDTHRHRRAGAEAVVGVTPELTFEIACGGKGPDRSDTETELAALARVLERLAARGFDLVLVEGFSAAPVPTIRVGETEPSANERTEPKPLGTGEDSVESLRAAIEAAEPIEIGSISSD